MVRYFCFALGLSAFIVLSSASQAQMAHDLNQISINNGVYIQNGKTMFTVYFIDKVTLKNGTSALVTSIVKNARTEIPPYGPGEVKVLKNEEVAVLNSFLEKAFVSKSGENLEYSGKGVCGSAMTEMLNFQVHGPKTPGRGVSCGGNQPVAGVSPEAMAVVQMIERIHSSPDSLTLQMVNAGK